MPLESGSTIESLDSSWPLGGDPTNRSDDHHRLIKSVLKQQFPGTGGNGFAVPIIATEDEINALSGITNNINGDITDLKDAVSELSVNLSAPTGTKMVFYQAAAPLGWTQDAANNDYMMRVINTAGGGKGGTDSPVNKSFTHSHSTGNHSLTAAQNGPHKHGISTVGDSNNPQGWTPTAPPRVSSIDSGGTNSSSIQSSGTGEPHNHGNTGLFTSTFAPKYLNVIIATKDAP